MTRKLGTQLVSTNRYPYLFFKEKIRSKVTLEVFVSAGVYSVTLDAEEGLATISGEVDPNILLKAITNTGKHAELKWVNFKHPAPNHYAGSGYYNNVDDDGYYGSHGYGYDYGYGSHSGAYGPTNQSYYGGRELMPPAEGMYWDAPQNYWPQPQGWPQVTDQYYYDYPSSYNYSSNYGYLPPSGSHYH